MTRQITWLRVFVEGVGGWAGQTDVADTRTLFTRHVGRATAAPIQPSKIPMRLNGLRNDGVQLQVPALRWGVAEDAPNLCPDLAVHLGELRRRNALGACKVKAIPCGLPEHIAPTRQSIYRAMVANMVDTVHYHAGDVSPLRWCMAPACSFEVT